MDIKLYNKYCKAKIAYKIYILFYNSLIDIANAPFEILIYPFGKKYHVCSEKFTVSKAKKTILNCKKLLDYYDSIEENKEIDKDFYLTEKETIDKINELNGKFNQSKFSSMKDTIIEISKARSYYFHEGLFDGIIRCYNDDTIDIAKNCLDRINKYME